MSHTDMAGVDRISPSPNGGGRHEKSLGLLTAKFVDLLQVAEGGVLDLKKVSFKAKFILIATSSHQIGYTGW